MTDSYNSIHSVAHGLSADSRVLLLVVSLCLFTACAVSKPQGIEPVQDFALQRYLGTWYEIARLDHRFERGLQQVTAHYQMRDDGGVKVINRGFDVNANEWSEAQGTAYFVEEPDVGLLKVSFFGPFYGSYVVFELDKQNYEYALVTGNDRGYFWLLSRSPDMSSELRSRLLAEARARGFAVDQLIWVEHSPIP